MKLCSLPFIKDVSGYSFITEKYYILINRNYTALWQCYGNRIFGVKYFNLEDASIINASNSLIIKADG